MEIYYLSRMLYCWGVAKIEQVVKSSAKKPIIRVCMGVCGYSVPLSHPIDVILMITQFSVSSWGQSAACWTGLHRNHQYSIVLSQLEDHLSMYRYVHYSDSLTTVLFLVMRMHIPVRQYIYVETAHRTLPFFVGFISELIDPHASLPCSVYDWWPASTLSMQINKLYWVVHRQSPSQLYFQPIYLSNRDNSRWGEFNQFICSWENGIPLSHFPLKYCLAVYTTVAVDGAQCQIHIAVTPSLDNRWIQKGVMSSLLFC